MNHQYSQYVKIFFLKGTITESIPYQSCGTKVSFSNTKVKTKQKVSI